jgi:hypothetical protein
VGWGGGGGGTTQRVGWGCGAASRHQHCHQASAADGPPPCPLPPPQALQSHAGFPSDASADHVTISPLQWEEFQQQFQAVLLLLRTVAGLWAQEDPCIIAGFDMDRLGTVQALSKEPAGTFIVRCAAGGSRGGGCLGCAQAHGRGGRGPGARQSVTCGLGGGRGGGAGAGRSSWQAAGVAPQAGRSSGGAGRRAQGLG